MSGETFGNSETVAYHWSELEDSSPLTQPPIDYGTQITSSTIQYQEAMASNHDPFMEPFNASPIADDLLSPASNITAEQPVVLTFLYQNTPCSFQDWNPENQDREVISSIPDVMQDEEPPMTPIIMRFAKSNHVLSGPNGESDRTPIYVKVDKLVQLKLSSAKYVALGLYHSHPGFCQKLITTANAKCEKKQKMSLPPNHTPFEVHVGPNSIFYKTIQINGEGMQVGMNAAIFHVENINLTNLTFRVSSTDPANEGQLKDAKEWKLLAIPLTEQKFVELRDAQESTVYLDSKELEFHAELRVQVMEEIRKNAKLCKGHRKSEIILPTSRKVSAKRKLLEEKFISIQRKKMKMMSDEELEDVTRS